MEALKTQLSAIVAEAQSSDAWTSRARLSFLYVMYALLLWAIPMGLIAAAQPETAEAIGSGLTAHLNGLPEPPYALLGTRPEERSVRKECVSQCSSWWLSDKTK